MRQSRRCRQRSKLVKAHVIPRAWYELNDPKGPLKLLSDAGPPATSRTGVYDRDMLCGACDQDIGKLDQYATENLLRSSAYTLYPEDKPHCRIYTATESSQILRFITSLLLRAHWSAQPMFRRVDLGAFEASTLALVNGVECDAHIDAAVTEFGESVPFLGPYRDRFDGVNYWVVSANRFMFWVKVDRRSLVGLLKGLSLRSTGCVHSVLRDWDGSKQRDAMKQVARRVHDRYGPLWSAEPK